MISPRYLPYLAVLLGLALVPTIIHSYADDTERDGRETSRLPMVLAGYSATPTDRDSTWGERRFESHDWVERGYVKAGDRVRLAVVRSFDPKSLYHHPELAIAYGTPFIGVQAQRWTRRPDVPVFVLEPGRGSNAAGFYVLHYGSTFVEAPIRFQLQTAGELLLTRRKEMTLFFMLDPQLPQAGLERSGAADVLFAAIDAFLQPASPGGS